VQGLNFYPQWSTQLVSTNREGQLAYRLTERAGDGFAEMLATYYQRYRVPIIVTETSAHGTNALRSRWLASAVGAIRSVRARGCRCSASPGTPSSR
jgi:beta-glucosidase